MTNHSFQRHLFTGLSLAALVAPAWTAQAGITAQVRSQSLRLGESTQLVVTFRSSKPVEPNVPHVDDLEIVPVHQHHALQMINGAVAADVTHTYQVTPDRAGNLTIPAIAAPGVGSTLPIVLRVDKGPGGQTQRTPQRRSQLQAPSIGRNDDTDVDARGQSAFLRVILPKQELTVGELVPVEVKAYFRAGVSASLNGLPVLSSDAFTLNKLSDQPEQSQEVIDGASYTVVTWSTALSAVKAGDYHLNLDLPVMVRVKEKAKRGGRNPLKDFFGDDSMFDDPFFDNFFGGTIEKPLTLHTDGTAVKIKPLPAQGRPADFSGAVGQFEVTSEAKATTGTTGDPLTLKMNVTGHGNFDRVSTNGLPVSAAWKSYKPNARFEAADRAGTSGTKTFEQSIIPMNAGAQEIPALHFSYFDPDTQKYVTKTTSPITVEIAQGSSVAPVAPVPDTPQPSADGLAVDQAVPVLASSSLRPLVLTPWFIALNAIMAAALPIGAIFNLLRRRRTDDPQRLQREAAQRSVADLLAAMDAALKAQDAPRFFNAARRALRERLAAQWHVPASYVTIHEIRARLNGNSGELCSLFQTADKVAYSGQRFTAQDLQQWDDLVKNQLQQINRL